MKKILILLTCLCTGFIFLHAQERIITGTVISAEDGEPIIGASILVKNTTNGTITNLDGKYSLKVNLPSTLVVSYIGMTTLEVPASDNLTIQLAATQHLLEEVVVVAYGQQRKEAITGAVSNIKSDKIERRPVGVATAVLEGQSPGVQVNNAYGEPGSTPEIRIRGFNSINGDNSPLYVINGVPMGAMNSNDINPADIESITVLKDAASAALYGNKAAAGVVLITTKSGRMGEDNLQIQATINQGIYQRGMKEYERLNAYQWMEAYWEARRNGLYSNNPSKYNSWNDANPDVLSAVISGIGEEYNIFNKSWDDLYDANGKLTSGTQIREGYIGDLDWYDPMMRNGSRSDYNLSIRGGTKKSSYYVGAGYLKEEGFMRGASGERFSGNAKIDAKPLAWLKLGGSMNASYRQNDYMKGDRDDYNSSYINPFYYSRNMSPIYPVHLHDPETGDYVLDASGNKQYDRGSGRAQSSSRHILWETELDQNKTYNTTIDMTGYVDINFLKDFVFTLKGNLNNRNSSDKKYNNAIIGDGSGSKGRMYKTDYRYRNYSGQQLLNWTRNFNDHHVEAFIGHENYYYNYEYEYLAKTGEIVPSVMELTNFTVMSTMNGYQSGYTTEGFFGRAGYSYSDKYFLEASYRRDGSSRFHKDNRWGNFWSVGGSWIISREEFMRQFDWIDHMKLRAAYGSVGKESSVGHYAYMALYTLTKNGGDGAAYRRQFDASDITWEKVKSLSLALETRLFDRVNFSIEYFDKTSKDLLFDLTLPLSIGTRPEINRPVKTVNFGSIANRGLEIATDVDAIRNRNFKWNVGLNLSFMTNKVLELPEEYGGEYISGSRKYMKGKSIYNWYMYQYIGVDRSNGRSLYEFNAEKYYIDVAGYDGPAAKIENDKRTLLKDTNSFTVIDGVAYAYNPTNARKDYRGSSIAKMYGSFTTSLRYKDFELSGLFTFQVGGKIFDGPYQSLMSVGSSPSAIHKDALKSWTPEQAGIGIDYNGTPALDTTNTSQNNNTSSRFLISSNYLNVKNVTLSYNVPKNFLKKFGVKGLLLSASGENLYMFTKRQGLNIQQSFGGSIGNGYPPARVYSFGLNLKF